MSKFKVGDKVVVDGYKYHRRIGFVTEVSNHGCMVDSGKMLGKHKLSDDASEFHLFFTNSKVTMAHTDTLQVGQTYTSKNGSEWECIFVRGGKAWMLGIYADGASGSAYDFDIDGTASWAGGSGADGYNIKWEPKRETVHTKGSWSKKGMPHPNHYQYNITFDLLDGTPDWTTAKVSPCD